MYFLAQRRRERRDYFFLMQRPQRAQKILFSRRGAESAEKEGSLKDAKNTEDSFCRLKSVDNSGDA